MSSCTHNQTSMQAHTNEDEEKQHAQPADTHGSPTMRLYRHALESILGMLPLDDLSRVLAVSREWSVAVKSMKPTHASIERDQWRSECKGKAFRPLPHIQSIVSSPLLRHLAGIRISVFAASWTVLDSASLGLLAQHAPNLTSLRCEINLMQTNR